MLLQISSRRRLTCSLMRSCSRNLHTRYVRCLNVCQSFRHANLSRSSHEHWTPSFALSPLISLSSSHAKIQRSDATSMSSSVKSFLSTFSRKWTLSGLWKLERREVLSLVEAQMSMLSKVGNEEDGDCSEETNRIE